MATGKFVSDEVEAVKDEGGHVETHMQNEENHHRASLNRKARA